MGFGMITLLYAAKKLKEIRYRGDVAAVARYDAEVEELRAAGAGLAAHVCQSLDT